MAQEKLEVIRAGHDAFNRIDEDAIRALMHPEVDFGTTGRFPGIDTTYRGGEGVVRWMHDVRSAWGEFQVTVDEIVHEGEDVIVVTERLAGRGRGSGVEVEMLAFAVYWVEDGRITRRRAFTERAEAISAAEGAG